VPLATNFRDVLIGRARRPQYVVPQSPQGTANLVDFWYQRWLAKRIEREEVLELLHHRVLLSQASLRYYTDEVCVTT